MSRPVTLGQVLRAWQEGVIDYRDAMQLSAVETLDDLYEAAHLNGVPIRTTLTATEREHALEVAPIIREGIAAARAA